MLDALLVTETDNAELLECYFLEALCCSLGATLLDSDRIAFDKFIKKLSCLTIVYDEKAMAGPGEIPGKRQTKWNHWHCLQSKLHFNFLYNRYGLE